jgi:hypothetical protein
MHGPDFVQAMRAAQRQIERHAYVGDHRDSADPRGLAIGSLPRWGMHRIRPLLGAAGATSALAAETKIEIGRLTTLTASTAVRLTSPATLKTCVQAWIQLPSWLDQIGCGHCH